MQSCASSGALYMKRARSQELRGVATRGSSFAHHAHRVGYNVNVGGAAEVYRRHMVVGGASPGGNASVGQPECLDRTEEGGAQGSLAGTVYENHETLMRQNRRLLAGQGEELEHAAHEAGASRDCLGVPAGGVESGSEGAAGEQLARNNDFAVSCSFSTRLRRALWTKNWSKMRIF